MELDPAEARHARKVLRLGRGDRILLFDGSGTEWEGEIVQGDPMRVRIVESRRRQRELAVPVTAACAVPKGRRLDWMVQKLTELGAHRIVPVAFSRSVARLGESKRARLEKLVVEASKQSGRGQLCRIEAECPLDGFVRGKFELLLVGSPDAAVGLSEVLEAPRPGEAAFVVGPEGGLTPEEEEVLLQAGGRPVRLAPAVLRVETAAIAMMAAFAQAFHETS
jgi:16S rRNA (uracil1498-N3)-methyltransferase